MLLTFYDFLAGHWTHVRTTNPIESAFATVRLRTEKTKGCGTRLAVLVCIPKESPVVADPLAFPEAGRGVPD